METERQHIIERKASGLKTVGIHIGEYFASRNPIVISTFLGSCVAACLYDRKRRIGGMNHILVPGKARYVDFNSAARFSINAMELLINAMLKLGADRNDIIAKVFGGANVIPGLSEVNSVGSKNCKFVLEYLKNERIRLMAQDLGGYKSRKLFFHTDTGSVYLRRSHSMKSSHLALMEQKKLEKLAKQMEQPTDIVLFNQSD